MTRTSFLDGTKAAHQTLRHGWDACLHLDNLLLKCSILDRDMKRASTAVWPPATLPVEAAHQSPLIPGFQSGENGEVRAHSTRQRWMRDAFGFAQKTICGHCNPNAVTQLLLKTRRHQKDFPQNRSCCLFYPTLVLFDRRVTASTCLLSIPCRGPVVRCVRVCVPL